MERDLVLPVAGSGLRAGSGGTTLIPSGDPLPRSPRPANLAELRSELGKHPALLTEIGLRWFREAAGYRVSPGPCVHAVHLLPWQHPPSAHQDGLEYHQRSGTGAVLDVARVERSTAGEGAIRVFAGESCDLFTLATRLPCAVVESAYALKPAAFGGLCCDTGIEEESLLRALAPGGSALELPHVPCELEYRDHAWRVVGAKDSVPAVWWFGAGFAGRDRHVGATAKPRFRGKGLPTVHAGQVRFPAVPTIEHAEVRFRSLVPRATWTAEGVVKEHRVVAASVEGSPLAVYTPRGVTLLPGERVNLVRIQDQPPPSVTDKEGNEMSALRSDLLRLPLMVPAHV